ncbi:uncharacterized protein N7515_009563 [Penicillium bovifimosum]|uniref:Uncharacterized protein n=1 Tax=Penicillium bovifimosum TaxID=126998 RepID=A0A9W9GKT5_9EURO|nr:uncharacterized protein N7515_009563 [Penicillium bovifimosum]KAJ5121602.1 hypothetical protein N7515_009563 [Penicillium bovifimosum]
MDHTPPWGRLPVEQYFIINWNHSSTETLDQQRKRLVAEFLDMDSFPYVWTEDWDTEALPESLAELREPTAEEVDTILRPYRSDLLRWHAMDIFHGEFSPAFLRTYYSADEGERDKHAKLMAEWGFSAEDWCAVLDNEDLFNFGSEWRRVYEILPEIAGPLVYVVDKIDEIFHIPRAPRQKNVDAFRSLLKTQLAEAKQTSPETWREHRHVFVDDYTTELQHYVTRTCLIIADEEAFRSGRLQVIYLDGFRNIVRELRLDAEFYDISSVDLTWMIKNAFPEDFTVGEKYRVSAELGRELYQFTEEDLADPTNSE